MDITGLVDAIFELILGLHASQEKLQLGLKDLALALRDVHGILKNWPDCPFHPIFEELQDNMQQLVNAVKAFKVAPNDTVHTSRNKVCHRWISSKRNWQAKPIPFWWNSSVTHFRLLFYLLGTLNITYEIIKIHLWYTFEYCFAYIIANS